MIAPKHVVFDYDGTLSNSMPAIWAAVQMIFRELNVRVPTLLDFISQFGTPATTFYRIFGIPSDVPDQTIWDIYRGHVDESSVALFPDTISSLRALAKANFKISLVSAKPDSALRATLAKFGCQNLFDTIIGCHERPKSDLFKLACKAVGVPTTDSVAVGDILSDLTEARLAGLTPIGITRGNREAAAVLSNSGAFHVVDDLVELVRFLTPSTRP